MEHLSWLAVPMCIVLPVLFGWIKTGRRTPDWINGMVYKP